MGLSVHQGPPQRAGVNQPLARWLREGFCCAGTQAPYSGVRWSAAEDPGESPRLWVTLAESSHLLSLLPSWGGEW